MVKKTNKSMKPGHAVGLEYDNLAIRAARLALDGKGGILIENLIDATGNFGEDADLIDGLRQVKDRLKMGAKDKVFTCLAGKQVSASQITFRKLPPDEMEQALRIEMRKSTPFDVAGSTLDYQILGEPEQKAETVQILVAMAGAGLLTRQLKILEKADINPASIDVLPVAVCNALWTYVGSPPGDGPLVALHIGPQVSTIVIDGQKSQFFNRYIYFAAEETIGKDPMAPESERRTQSLVDEVSRSLAFYEKSTFATGFREILLLGDYLESKVIEERIRRKTGLTTRKMDLPNKLGLGHDSPAGRFDLAVSLAFRGGQE